MNYKLFLFTASLLTCLTTLEGQTSSLGAKAGELVTIEFPVEPQSRDYWRLESMHPENALVLQRQEFVPTDEGTDKTAFVFKAIRSGTARLVFEQQIIPTEVGMSVSTKRRVYQINITN